MADAILDFRIMTNFPGHRKTRRMLRLLGDKSVLAYLKILARTREMRPDGVLSNMTVEDIAEEADWDGDACEYVETMWIRVRYLDRQCDICHSIVDVEKGRFVRSEAGGVVCSDCAGGEAQALSQQTTNGAGWYVVHDWPEHNPWSCGQRDRAEQARRAGKASGCARRKRKGDNNDPNQTELPVEQKRTNSSTESNSQLTGSSDQLNPVSDSDSVSDSISNSGSVSDARARVQSEAAVDNSEGRANPVRSLNEFLKSEEGRAQVIAMARKAANDQEYSGKSGDTSTWVVSCTQELREYVEANPDKFLKPNWGPYIAKWLHNRVDKHRKYCGAPA